MIKNTEENMLKFNKYINQRKENDLDIIDLVKYLSSNHSFLFKDALEDSKKQKLEQIIDSKDSYLLILVDGLGYYKVQSLNENSILKRACKYKLNTVNPTSTACILTSIFTCRYPLEHGVFGWWQYSKKLNKNYYPLLMQTKDDEKIKPRDIFKFDSIFDSFSSKVNIYMNRQIINSDFSKVFAGKKASRYGYYSVRESFEKIQKNINPNVKSFNYLYIDGLDNMSHVYGIDSIEVQNIINEIERGIINIKRKFENLKIIVIADHGQTTMNSMLYLNQNNDYSKYFYALPSIDTRCISFFVKDEFKDEFETKFMDEFSKDVILFTKEEIENNNLFGNGKFSNIANDAIGEYVAFIVNEKFMVCDKITYEDKMFTKGNHSGLTRYETTIPLIVI